jgi:hypothetical protein
MYVLFEPRRKNATPISAKQQGDSHPWVAMDMMDQGAASWTEIADGTLCGQDPDEIGVPARWPMDGTEDERQGFGTEWAGRW